VKEIVGLDPDPGVLSNQAIDKGVVATAEDMPFPDARFDAAVSSFTLEHIERPEAMAREVFRVLRPGGIFIFRTPNLWHYVSLPAKLTPHWVHKLLANRLRGMSCEGAPSPFPTLHLCNTRRRIVKIFTKAGFKVEELQTIEPEPSYLQFSGIAFLLGVAYERLVNSTPYLSAIRVTIFAGLRKPIVHRKKT
jgi:ubiquinone/menaquinone biosynthesis C-methylase UbiE